MWVIEYVGRYCAQSGRNLAAQQPRTMRWFQGAEGEGGTELMVDEMRRTMSSALFVSCGVVSKPGVVACANDSVP